MGLSVFDEDVTLVIDREIPDAGTYRGLDGVRSYMTAFLDAWEPQSLSIKAESFAESGDTVLVKVNQAGVGKDSGAPVETSYFQLWTFRGDSVIRLETIMREEAARKAAGLGPAG